MNNSTKSLFATKNLRCTRQRIEVYAALASTKRHPTADELHNLVQHSTPGTSLATVYNTLETLCDAGLCQKINTPAGAARYDADLSRHLHVVNDDGSVIDVPDDLSKKITSSLPNNLADEIAPLCNGSRASHLTIQIRS